MHLIRKYLFIYLLKGNGELYINNRKQALNSGDFVVCRPFESKSFTPYPEEPCEFYAISFNGRHCTDLLTNLNLIPKKNYSPDRLTIAVTSKVIKKGGCVTFAPEGLASDYGGNKPIVPGTSKMFKHFKVPVYLCYLEGQYLQNTKVCLDERYGETHATMSLLFSKEDIERLSVEEMDDIINEKNGIIINLKDRISYFKGIDHHQDINNLADAINYLIKTLDFKDNNDN